MTTSDTGVAVAAAVGDVLGMAVVTALGLAETCEENTVGIALASVALGLPDIVDGASLGLSVASDGQF